MNINVALVGPVVVPLPRYQTDGAAGMDLHAALRDRAVLGPGDRRFIPAGIAIEIPRGFEGQVRARSGLALRKGLGVVNSPGTIDSDFRGEIGVLLINFGKDCIEIHPLDRIGQIVFAPVVHVTLTKVDALSPTARHDGGYGSTGLR